MTLTSKNSNLSIRWTQHIKDEKQKERFIQAVRNDTLVLGRLKEILQEDLEQLAAKEVRTDSYDCPSWAYRQAHYNGIRQAIANVNSLLDFLK